MKKNPIAFILAAALALGLAACSSPSSPSTPTSPSSTPAISTQIPNPVVDYDSVEAAQDAMGYTALVPTEVPSGYSQTRVGVIDDTLLEIDYSNGEQTITYRTQKGEPADISGVYTEYPETEDLTVGDLAVTTYGAEGLVNVAIWNNGGSNYAIIVDPEGAGLSVGEVEGIIKSVQ